MLPPSETIPQPAQTEHCEGNPPPSASSDAVSAIVAVARSAGRHWAGIPLRNRLKVVRSFRHRLAVDGRALAEQVNMPQRQSVAQTLSSEVLPLADACRFLERNADKLLRTRTVRRGRPFWLAGHRLTISREPLGTVLIIGPFNYPLMLAGIQAAAALVAGNAVIIKPGQGGKQACDRMAEFWRDAGLPDGTLTILTESADDARHAIQAGVDKIILTGSARTGRAVMQAAAEHLTPSIMELSGCDAMIVLPDANLDMVADAVAFGMRFNAGCTCVAPRRLIAHDSVADPLLEKLDRRIASIAPAPIPEPLCQTLGDLVEEAKAQGAVVRRGGLTGSSLTPMVIDRADTSMSLLREDLFAPLISVVRYRELEEAVSAANDCPYALGATVFGPSKIAEAVAARIEVGVVSVNDFLAPIADPRLPMEGHRQSGFGPTRGAEGLLAMTRVKAATTRSGTFRPHFDAETAHDLAFFEHYLQAVHAPGLLQRLKGMLSFVRSLIRKSKAGRQERALP